RFLREGLRAVIIAAVIRRDLVSRIFERNADRLPDPACASRYDDRARHDVLAVFFVDTARSVAEGKVLFNPNSRRETPDDKRLAPLGTSPRRLAPDTSRCPCRRRCRGWRDPSWPCAGASRTEASRARGRPTRQWDGRSRWRRH